MQEKLKHGGKYTWHGESACINGRRLIFGCRKSSGRGVSSGRCRSKSGGIRAIVER
jgi:hypothetical protein